MWLVAPQIPNSVKEFLERFGIEYSEIHTVEFRRVAERHNVTVGLKMNAAGFRKHRR